ncbi:DapH/DapD/GlmU-related protein [Halalkalibacter hemicellulosilyticus]|uniref:Chloramphenicol acetyltransferase n=1 Tax=Halalkalibacter hemicellulosilyticusJCM 9152 TaxID=1236971 RepID=W4QJP7_9BACI|nr:DapH/DapD/GlmU-related protein [Halalkalibacter hemicellulosilyticus]GAE32137.1 chloramphenicol acetyltransferase [Halalkalibacter hemicellulosilyticusJCM 9152]
MKKLNSTGPTIHETAKVRFSQIGKWTEIDERVRVTESNIGDYSYVLHDSEMIYTNVGKFCAIAPFTRINAGNHPISRPALANFTYRSSQYDLGENDQNFFQSRREQKVTIGHDVWIGQAALIMPGVSIGTGAVVGGGAVVTKDVAPYTIVAGVEAKPIRRRFSSEIENALLRIAWWDWDHSKIKDSMADFRNLSIEEFCGKYDPIE